MHFFAMYHDVSEFRNFYYQSRLGRSVQRRIQETIHDIWGDNSGGSLVGFGFASPFLRPLRGRFQNLVNLMPDGQGVMAWPPGERNASVLCSEDAWPILAGSADYVLIAHALESSENPNALLEEIWRILAPEGKALFILPNRLGIWASSEATPFGFGRPYSSNQVRDILNDNRFEVTRMDGALYAPPLQSRWGMKMARFFEWGLKRPSRRYFAGVLVVEVTKRVGVSPPKLRQKDPIYANPILKPLVQKQ